ncbi:HlyD family secretion protein [Rhodobacteraceae bacterium NNCM2]|nr:HlyD family secretion protein [Coraliihabitans acroporae]
MARRLIRWLMRAGLLIGGPAAILIGGLYFYMTSGRYVSTENAYVKADLIIVAPEISGRVVEVAVANNQAVAAGDVLFRLDPRRFEVEVTRRAAELRMARQKVTSLKARYRTKLAELAAATADLKFQRDELTRSEKLRLSGTISEFRLVEMRRETSHAETQIDVIREEIAEALSELGGDPGMPPDNHPDVLSARALLSEAELDLHAATIRAPAAAITANVNLQVGEYVEEGDPVLSLVGSEAVWVEANLKETDLTHLSVGQPAVLTVDAYPAVEWRAVVSSLSPATGAEYALLPPQNASGNWVKVVQRVPVRLEVEPMAGAPALRAGMSVAVSIDTGYERPLPDVVNKARAWISAGAAR